MQQGSNAGGSGGGAGTLTATLTDEQILELEPGAGEVAAGQNAPASDPAKGTAADDALLGGESDPGRGALGNDPAWLATLEAQAQGGAESAAEARAWRAAARDVAAIDAAYFSTAPEARSGLAARLYASDPAAFRAMLTESARMLAERDPQGLAEMARVLGDPQSAVQAPAANAEKSVAQAVRQDQGAPNAAANGNAGAFPVEAYRTFETSTNDEVSRRMHDAIGRTLESTLPSGIAEGARRRIGEDIFQEVHASLAGDRDLTRQVGELLRGWRFDAAARQQIVGLVAGRARGVLPEVSRRVVAEWTSSVLASDRARTARIDTAASRRDVTGGRLPEPVPASSLRPRDIDYRRTSDDQILEM